VNRYVMPLFIAAKHFDSHLRNVNDNFVSFIISVTKLDGGFGYITKEAYDPIYAGIYGVGLCLRKEFEKSVVKVIDFPKDAENLFMVKKIFYELQYSDMRCAVSYSTSGKRYTLMALPTEMKKEKENFTLSRKRILVTGGGRGLGSLFCKIASRRWKPTIIILDIIELNDDAAKFALMNEEQLNDYKNNVLKNELKKKYDKVTPIMLEKEFARIKDSANLYRAIKEIESLGAKVHYYQCDLNNPVRFGEVMNDIKERFGMIDGFIHFAGLERSKLAVDKSVEEFLLIFNTKANSAVNIWRSQILRDDALVVMISSIAGKFGNVGQTDYAAASDYISKFAINLFNQGRKAFAIDMTAVANIGMGARPSVEAFLRSQEVEFLYPQEVMGTLCDEISYGDIPEIIYSCSLGKLDWDKQLVYEKDFPISSSASSVVRDLYFIERIEKNSSSLGFSAVKNLSVKEKYLEDHSINDVPILPGVMGLEAFAQAVCAYKSVYPLVLRNVEFKLPVKLLKKKDLEIRIEAEGSSVVNLAIKSDFVNAKGVKIGDTRTHFTAFFDPLDKNDFKNVEIPNFNQSYKTDKESIYKTYFHGPSFQVLDGIIKATRDEVIAVFKKPTIPLLGDRDFNYIFHPLVIEALFQTCGWRDLYIDSKMTLPDSIEAVRVRDNKKDPEMLFTYAVFKGLNNFGKSVYDAWAFDEKGNIYAELINYVMIGVNII
ncbi:MAG: SDR family NAD(P)-dependent oxidoreductase, partial [Elusimicrobiales bacterium]